MQWKAPLWVVAAILSMLFGSSCFLPAWKKLSCSTDLVAWRTDEDGFLIESVKRLDQENSFACTLSWKKPVSGHKAVQFIEFQQRVVNSSADNGTVIRGPMVLETDLAQVNLICMSALHISGGGIGSFWNEGLCSGGNFPKQCVFSIDQITQKPKSVICSTMPQSIYTNGSSPVGNFVSLSWEGQATVIGLRADGVDIPIVNVPGTGLKVQLECEALGKPLPTAEVYLLQSTDIENSVGGIRQAEKGISKSNNTLKKTYFIKSDVKCNSVDIYRCDTSNANGNDSKFMSVIAKCPAEAKVDTTIIVLSIMGVITGVILISVLVIVVIRLQRRQGRRRSRSHSRQRNGRHYVDNERPQQGSIEEANTQNIVVADG